MDIGPDLPTWTNRPRPPRTDMVGRWSSVVPLEPSRHASALFDADSEGRDERWTYLFQGPFNDFDAYLGWMNATCLGEDPRFHTILDAAGNPVGIASYLRIDPANGSIEVGNINYTSRLQRTPAATEAMYLMLRRAFDELGYRRYEWKCDALNAPSRRAALRLGFTFEGIFRQHMIYKGRNRDTAWFSIIDTEWPTLRARFERWLSPENFNAAGTQRSPLVSD